MSDESKHTPAGTQWLLETWLKKLSSVIDQMTESKPSCTWSDDPAQPLGEKALIIEQSFGAASEPMLWVGLPESLHQELGKRVLQAAGVDVSDSEENRGTALEIAEQSLGALASELARHTGHAAKTTTKQCLTFPGEYPVISVTLRFGETALAPLLIAIHPSLLSGWEAAPVQSPVAPASPPAPKKPTGEQEASSSSRTFDVLLDVALPVSVSFGRTDLAVREVLKLTTGSIVELNRSISEPVDIIVNNCIIARGEVVVVDGNYGVRINKIVSRKERLRSGGAALGEDRAPLSAGHQ